MAHETTRFTVVGIGEILWDIYREDRYLGGAPTNVAIHATQLGDQGIIVSRIGNDGMGEELIRVLKKKKVVTDYLQIDRKKGTGSVHISLSVSGEPHFYCTDDVAFDYLQFTPALSKLAEEADAVVFGSLAQRNPVSRETIQKFIQKARGVCVFDLNARQVHGDFSEIVRNSLEYTRILKVNEEEMDLLKKVFHKEGDPDIAFCRMLMQQFPIEFVAVTRGEKGAALIYPDKIYMDEGVPVKPVDSTGAGDAFTAAMLHAYLRRQGPEQMVAFANLAAAYVCTHRGATPPMNQKTLKVFAEQHQKRQA